MRKGELPGLTWDCIDLTHGFIRLKQTKNGKARALPLNETLRGLFSGLRTRLDVPWVFHDAAGHRRDDVRHGFVGPVRPQDSTPELRTRAGTCVFYCVLVYS